MKNMYTISHEKKCLLNFCATYRHIQLPCSEQDYIEMHDLFLAPGTHHLEIENVSTGRNLIDVFLTTLKNFHEVGCLTVSADALPEYVTDIFQDMLMSGDFQNQEVIANYFLDTFSCDFLWIEADSELQNSQWFTTFNSVISQFRIDQQIPIVILTYE